MVLGLIVPVVMFVAGWNMLTRQPINLLRLLVSVILLKSLYFSYGFWLRLVNLFGFPSIYGATDNYFVYGIHDIFFVATIACCGFALAKLFSRTSIDLQRFQYAKQNAELRASTRTLSASEVEKLKLQLGLPSKLMIVAGVLGLLSPIAANIAFDVTAQQVYALAAVHGCIGVPLCLLMIIAGFQLQNASYYNFIRYVAFMALLPLSPVYPVFVAGGIWTLVVLNRKPVRRLFLDNADRQTQSVANLGATD
jgi:hypothetical protein